MPGFPVRGFPPAPRGFQAVALDASPEVLALKESIERLEGGWLGLGGVGGLFGLGWLV